MTGPAKWGWPACTALALGGYLAITAVCGADMAAMPRFFLAAVFWLWLPGRTLAAFLAPGGKNHSLYAFIYGSALLAGVQCVAARWGAFWLLYLLPPAVGLAGLWRRRGRLRAELRRGLLWLRSPRAALWAGLCLAYAICCSGANPHPAAAGAVALDRDFLWNMGNAAALSRHFPAEDLRFDGVRLAYHYLTELLWAALSRVSGAALFDVYLFFAGPVFLACELLALRALARACWPGQRRGERRVLALVFGFSCASMWKVLWDGLSVFGNTLLAHLLTNVNSQATALPYIAGVFCSFGVLARAGMRGGARQWGALFVSFALLCVAKGPQAALLLCGVAAAAVLLLVLRRVRVLPMLAGAAGLGAVFLAFYRFLYSGGVNSMEFSIFSMSSTVIYRVLSPWTDRLCALLPGTGYIWLVGLGLINAFCMLPLQSMLCLYGLPRALRSLPRPDPVRLLAAALAGGGMLAYHLFSHPSSSQVYFALLAMLCLSLLAAGPLGALGRSWRRLPALLAGAAGLVTTVCLMLSFAYRASGPLAACLGVQPAQATGRAVTAADEEAMQWLAENSDPEDVFATNRTSGTPELIDAISNVYSGLSGQQAYLDGWTYAMTNMGVDRAVLDRKIEVNETLTSGELDAEQAQALAQQESIQWLVLAKAWPGALPQGLEPVFENDSVVIARLGASETGE